MQDIKAYFCPRPDCRNYGLRGAGNLVKAGMYTRKNSGERKQMLKCTVCGVRFSETQSVLFAGCHYDGQTIRNIIASIAGGNSIRSTARNLGLSKDRVNKTVIVARSYADRELSGLLRSLHLQEGQLEELFRFVKIGARSVKKYQI